MKCSNCGEQIEEGRLFCTHCGHEIQWVPDYDSLGSYMERERMLKQEQEAAEAARRKAAAELRQKKKKRRIITTVTIALFAVVIICLVLAMKMHDNNKKYNDFDYQMTMADTAFSNQKYEKCYEYVERALDLDDSDPDAHLLKAQVLIKLNETEDAIKTLTSLIDKHPDNVTAYGLLIKLYNSNKMTEEIKELMDACENEDVRTKYAAYICSTPIFSVPSGEYTEQKELQLYAKSDDVTIYYTTDGKDPTADSIVYTDSISLTEGTTTIKAIAVNEKGISSDIVTNQYTISLTPPDPPQISPSSGNFTTNMDTKIYIIVPEGCKAYYAFDKKPTIADNLYDPNQPVEMLSGTHTFYAILVDENGKVSYPGSAIYKLEAAE